MNVKTSLTKNTVMNNFKSESLPWTLLIIFPGTLSIGTKYLSTNADVFSMISPSLIDGCQCSFIMSSKLACCKSKKEIYEDADSFNSIFIYGGAKGNKVFFDMSTETVARFLTWTITSLIFGSYLCPIAF